MARRRDHDRADRAGAVAPTGPKMRTASKACARVALSARERGGDQRPAPVPAIMKALAVLQKRRAVALAHRRERRGRCTSRRRAAASAARLEARPAWRSRSAALGRQPLAEALDHQRQRDGLGTVKLDVLDAQAAQPAAGRRQQRQVELLRQRLALGLGEQAVAGVVLAEDLEEQRRRLQLARALRVAPG